MDHFEDIDNYFSRSVNCWVNDGYYFFEIDVDCGRRISTGLYEVDGFITGNCASRRIYHRLTNRTIIKDIKNSGEAHKIAKEMIESFREKITLFSYLVAGE